MLCYVILYYILLHGCVEYSILIGQSRHSAVCYFCITDRCYVYQTVATDAALMSDSGGPFLRQNIDFFSK